MNGSCPVDMECAEELKQVANLAFNERKFQQAIDLYTQAIEANPKCAVYYANRAFAHTKLEEYGSAVEDSTTAIELDRKYVKGYYRRGTAYLLMGKFKEALKDFRQVVRIRPNDPDAKRQCRECEKAVQKIRFEEAIWREDTVRRAVSETIDISAMGMYLSRGNHETKGMNKIYGFDGEVKAKFDATMSDLFQEVFCALPLANVLNGKVIVVHGGLFSQDGVTLQDIRNIDRFTEPPDEEVDDSYTGPRLEGEEVTLEFVKTMMEEFRKQKSLHKRYAYQILLRVNEISKATPTLVDITVPEGSHITVCGDIHGQYYDLLNIFEMNGLPSDENPYLFNGDFVDRGSFSVEVIFTLFAFKCLYPNGLMCELLWSDPQPDNGRSPSKRGVGVAFGPDVTSRFLQENNLELIVRSHEVREEGCQLEHNGKLITVFSAPNYCDQMGNLGAYIRFESDMVPKFTKFKAVPHPNVKPMQYATNFMNFLV
ncbi:hypothetical protein CBR_g3721 [Chara braunii]|uniref:protein-serine/threonine phosphatase n=1 Tax=Chara braunii TaxID=69332 RepID=A0A388KG53_CHABU|nr:hypothetical protein CBR_g3721 [Chara braunii]|eukprot:GBG69021.1 hypothetical protein CBR_g3721 [Chara braunii]